jgi:hypothetical protein
MLLCAQSKQDDVQQEVCSITPLQKETEGDAGWSIDFRNTCGAPSFLYQQLLCVELIQISEPAAFVVL